MGAEQGAPGRVHERHPRICVDRPRHAVPGARLRARGRADSEGDCSM